MGRAGLFNSKNYGPVELVLIYLGNFVGVSWIALILKLMPNYYMKIYAISEAMLRDLSKERFDTIFILSIFAGMMTYAGIVAFKQSNTWAYFVAAIAIIMLTEWPLLPVVSLYIWLDDWQYWEIIFPVTIGNIIGVHIWSTLRQKSDRYKDNFKPDSYDIADKFHDFVYNNQNLRSNKDSHFDK